ncbi:MAG: RHS repeat-associated core domain-containing protein [Chitinophagaceae bacterium]
MITPTPIKASSILQYDPFGMLLVGRNWEGGSEYRFGFNGMEGDDEIAGNDNVLDFGARIYDCKLGKWLSGDVYAKLYPQISPYTFAINNPIKFVDPDGNTIFDSEGNEVTLIFDSETGELSQIQGTADQNLIAVLTNTWNESETGKTTINDLNAEDIKVKVVVSDKAGLVTINGTTYDVVGLTSVNMMDGENFKFKDEDGTIYNSRIILFNSTLSAASAESENIEVVGEGSYLMEDSKSKQKVINKYKKSLGKKGNPKHGPTDEAIDKLTMEDPMNALILALEILPLSAKDQDFGAVTTLIHEKVHADKFAGKQDDQGEYLPRKKEIKSYKEFGRPLPDNKDD